MNGERLCVGVCMFMCRLISPRFSAVRKPRHACSCQCDEGAVKGVEGPEDDDAWLLVGGFVSPLDPSRLGRPHFACVSFARLWCAAPCLVWCCPCLRRTVAHTCAPGPRGVRPWQEGDAELERIAAARAADSEAAARGGGGAGATAGQVGDVATAVSDAVRAFVGRVSGFQGVDDG